MPWLQHPTAGHWPANQDHTHAAEPEPARTRDPPSKPLARPPAHASRVCAPIWRANLINTSSRVAFATPQSSTRRPESLAAATASNTADSVTSVTGSSYLRAGAVQGGGKAGGTEGGCAAWGGVRGTLQDVCGRGEGRGMRLGWAAAARRRVDERWQVVATEEGGGQRRGKGGGREGGAGRVPAATCSPSGLTLACGLCRPIRSCHRHNSHSHSHSRTHASNRGVPECVRALPRRHLPSPAPSPNPHTNPTTTTPHTNCRRCPALPCLPPALPCRPPAFPLPCPSPSRRASSSHLSVLPSAYVGRALGDMPITNWRAASSSPASTMRVNTR